MRVWVFWPPFDCVNFLCIIVTVASVYTIMSLLSTSHSARSSADQVLPCPSPLRQPSAVSSLCCSSFSSHFLSRPLTLPVIFFCSISPSPKLDPVPPIYPASTDIFILFKFTFLYHCSSFSALSCFHPSFSLTFFFTPVSPLHSSFCFISPLHLISHMHYCVVLLSLMSNHSFCNLLDSQPLT